ncbi:MAG: PAS domain S-box protein [Candidatus Hydrogenedentes bacterium]|nr:PAS domain S-box protein [Candidatus Hydrogenedentota bacterium]
MSAARSFPPVPAAHRPRLLVAATTLLLLLLALSTRSSAQEMVPKHIQVFRPGDGLAGELIRGIVKAPDGAIWFACWASGISRYDGYTWTTYDESRGLPTNDVRALLLDQEKRLWCGTTEGIAYFDAARWRPIKPPLPGLPTPSVLQTYLLKNGAVWFVLENTGILQFQPRPRQSAAPAEEVGTREPSGEWSLVFPQSQLKAGQYFGDVLPVGVTETWVSVIGAGTELFDGKNWSIRWEGAEEKQGIVSFAQTDNGVVWAAGTNFLIKYADGVRTVIPSDDAECLALGAGDDDVLYVGTSKGLRTYSRRQWQSVAVHPSPMFFSTQPFNRVGPNEMWFGAGNGAYRLTTGPWNARNTAQDGTAVDAVALYADPEQTPMLADRGGTIYRWDRDRWQSVVRANAQGSKCLGMSEPHGGTVWLLFSDRIEEVSISEKSARRSVPIPAFERSARICAGASGHVFVSADDRVFELTDTTWRLLRTQSAQLVRSLFEDSGGSLWVKWSNFSERYKDGEWRLELDTNGLSLKNLESLSELPDHTVLLHIANEGIFSLQNGRSTKVCSVDAAASNQSTALCQASDGTIWVGSPYSGISSYRNDLWLDYGDEQGVPNGRVRFLGEDPEGKIWARIEGAGVFRYEPDRDYPEARVAISSKFVASRDRGIFKFSGIDKWKLTPAENLYYSWRILAGDSARITQDWTTWSRDTLAVAPLLGPGHYTLQMRVVDHDRNSLPRPVEEHFEVQGPFWRSPAFYLPVGGLVLAVVVLSAAWVRKQRLLAASEKKYREILNSINEIIFTLSPNGVISYISPGLRHILGHEPQSVIGTALAAVMQDTERERFQRNLAELGANESFKEEFQFVSRSGETRWLRLSCQTVSRNGEILDIKGVATDITTRKRAEDALKVSLENLESIVSERTQELRNANQSLRQEIKERSRIEEALRENEAKYRNLVENLPQRIFIKDRDLVFVSCNELFAADLKRSPADVAGTTDFDYFPRPLAEKYREDDRKVMASEQIVDIEETHVVDGQEVWVHTVKAPVRDRHGHVTGVLGIFWDITDRKQMEADRIHLEEQLAHAQRMESVGHLAGGVAHDFNNILSIILGYGELMLDELPADSSMRGPLSEIMRAGEHARDLTKQLLAFSRKQVLQVEVVDLNTIVRNMEKMLRRVLSEDIEVRISTPPGIGHINADTAQLEQVILNLCVNARDAMPRGGTLTIETSEFVLDEITAIRHVDLQAGPYVLLSVSDTGEGMDADTQRRIFDPFFTTKTKGKGTGLGLATAYGIIKQHRGAIWVYSEPGHGSTFKVCLPLVYGSAQEPQTCPIETKAPGQGEVILVIEDEEAVREITCRMLTRLGYAVIQARNPEECFELAGASARIDLLLTDVIMPGTNGREVYERVAQICPGIKALFMSGYSEDVIGHHGILDPGIFFISKPFTEGALSRKVREALSS